MKLKQLIIVAAAVALMGGAALAANPKREFRGAWMHTVYQGQYAQKGTAELQAYLIDQLDKLNTCINKVVGQYAFLIITNDNPAAEKLLDELIK